MRVFSAKTATFRPGKSGLAAAARALRRVVRELRQWCRCFWLLCHVSRCRIGLTSSFSPDRSPSNIWFWQNGTLPGLRGACYFYYSDGVAVQPICPNLFELVLLKFRVNGCVLFQESEHSLCHLSMVKRETGKAGSTALTFIAYAKLFSFSSRDNF